MRKDARRMRPCEWCGVAFLAKRRHGVEQRFHTTACVVAAKRAHGVIPPEGADPSAPRTRAPAVLTGHRVLPVRREEA